MVEAAELLGPDRVRPGDALIAMASSGLHSNGFSLVRTLIDDHEGGLPLDAAPPGLGRTLGEELLIPTRIYARDCLAVAAGCDVHAFAHITGGGLAANLGRVLPPGADALVDRGTWRPPPVFGLRAELGVVTDQQEVESETAYAELADRYADDDGDDEDEDEDEDGLDDDLGRHTLAGEAPRRANGAPAGVSRTGGA